MTTVDFYQVIRDSREELKQLLKERDRLDQRISQVVSALRALVRMLEESQRGELLDELKAARRKAPSLTESISVLLMNSKVGLMSSEIKERLEDSGFDLSEYSQPMGTILTTLQRLAESGRAKKSLNKEKNVIYSWAGEAKK